MQTDWRREPVAGLSPHPPRPLVLLAMSNRSKETCWRHVCAFDAISIGHRVTKPYRFAVLAVDNVPMLGFQRGS